MEWYKQYLDVLSPRLYVDCFEQGGLPTSFYEAHVVLLPKPDKDLLCCSSYRPIPLLNMDLKILTRMLANRLMKIIHYLVSPDHTGFMPKKATDINIRRVYTHTQLGAESSSGRAVVFFDLEKAFDSIDWGYMIHILQRMGFGPIFLKWILLLYEHPVAALRVNGGCLRFFQCPGAPCRGAPFPLVFLH